MDVFPMWVEHVAGEGDFASASELSHVSVAAWTTNEATLTALEMVAARGRCPTSVSVDWDAY